jgi:hypothetical protein
MNDRWKQPSFFLGPVFVLIGLAAGLVGTLMKLPLISAVGIVIAIAGASAWVRASWITGSR